MSISLLDSPVTWQFSLSNYGSSIGHMHLGWQLKAFFCSLYERRWKAYLQLSSTAQISLFFFFCLYCQLFQQFIIIFCHIVCLHFSPLCSHWQRQWHWNISSFYTLFSSLRRESTLNSQHLKKSFFVTNSSKRVVWMLLYSRTTLRDKGSLRLWNCTQAVCGESLLTTVGTSSTYWLQEGKTSSESSVIDESNSKQDRKTPQKCYTCERNNAWQSWWFRSSMQYESQSFPGNWIHSLLSLHLNFCLLILSLLLFSFA